MREILAVTISAVVSNIGLIASAEPDRDKREILVRELAEAAIEGIQDCKERMINKLYDAEVAELDATIILIKKAYHSNHNNNK